MIGSMYSAVSGLQAHQTKMDVIGNNIANVNTYGYKANRATFADMFYSSRSVASAPNANQGGTNPSQLGYGAKVASVDVIYTRSGPATTNRPLDVYINGDGFIAVKTSDGLVKYTRAGVLSIDTAGNLVDRNGNMVLGLSLNQDTQMPKLDKDGKANIQSMVPIKLDPTMEYTGVEISPNGEVVAMQPGAPVFTPSPNSSGVSVTGTVSPESLYDGGINMTIKRSESMTLIAGTYNSAALDGLAGTPIKGITLGTSGDLEELGLSGELTLKIEKVSETEYAYTLSDKSGKSITSTVTTAPGDLSATPDAGTATNVTFIGGTEDEEYTLTVKLAYSTPTTDKPADDDTLLIQSGSTDVSLSIGTAVASTMTVKGSAYEKSGDLIEFPSQNINFAGATPQSEFTMGDIVFKIDPVSFGVLNNVTDLQVGSVGAGTSTPVKLGQVGLITFYNQDGLSQAGEDYYVETLNSGEAQAYVPGRAGTGTLLAGSLEMSNVDLSREFTEMIITQRGFQANTRMVTVSDEMLQELLSMKR